MPFANPADRRRWQLLDRIKRQLRKQCRDCSNPARTTVLCTTCYEKQYARRPWLLEVLNGRKQALQHQMYPGTSDRRRNGRRMSRVATT